jgi:hypothetical protein
MYLRSAVSPALSNGTGSGTAVNEPHSKSTTVNLSDLPGLLGEEVKTFRVPGYLGPEVPSSPGSRQLPTETKKPTEARQHPSPTSL